MTLINLEDVETYLLEHPLVFATKTEQDVFKEYIRGIFAVLRAREEAKSDIHVHA